MRDYFLRFTDRKQAVAELLARGIKEQFDADGQPVQFWQTYDYAVELIGEIGKPAEIIIDPETGLETIVSPAIPPNGYLVNLRWRPQADEPEFGAFDGRPSHPKRVFA